MILAWTVPQYNSTLIVEDPSLYVYVLLVISGEDWLLLHRDSLNMNGFESSWSQSSAPGMSFLSQWDHANNTACTVRQASNWSSKLKYSLSSSWHSNSLCLLLATTYYGYEWKAHLHLSYMWMTTFDGSTVAASSSQLLSSEVKWSEVLKSSISK